jgi:hypothetical protein
MKYLLIVIVLLLLAAPVVADRLTYIERYPFLGRCLVAKMTITSPSEMMVFYNCGTSASMYELVTSGAYRMKEDGSLLIDSPTTFRLGGPDGHELWLSDPNRNGLSGDETPMPRPAETLNPST